MQYTPFTESMLLSVEQKDLLSNAHRKRAPDKHGYHQHEYIVTIPTEVSSKMCVGECKEAKGAE